MANNLRMMWMRLMGVKSLRQSTSGIFGKRVSRAWLRTWKPLPLSSKSWKHSHNQAEKACRKSVVRARSLVLRHPFKSLPNFGLAEWGVKLGQVRRLEERCKVQGEVAHNLSTEQPLKVGESLRSHAVHVRDQGVTTLQTEDPIFLAMEGGVQYGRKMCCRRCL